MPLEWGDFWHLDEEPLSGCVVEVLFHDVELHYTAWVNEDL